MPAKSEKQRRAMHAAARGKSTLGIPRKAAKRFLSHGKADGGKMVPTGSAGVTAPTIATSARGYAEGGKVANLMDYIKKKDRERLDRQKAAKKRRDAAMAKSHAIADTERANRAAAQPRARQATRSKLARAATPKLPATKPPKQPAKVTVGRDGSVTTTRRSQTGATKTTKRTPPSRPAKPTRKTTPRPAAPAQRRVRGPTGAARKATAKRATGGGGSVLRRAINRLTEANRESVKRARAHGNRD